jgi:membrane protease YdiL (CAAX protease family)
MIAMAEPLELAPVEEQRTSLREVLVFLLLACALSWPLWFAVVTGFLPLTPLGAFAPSLAAAILTRLLDGKAALGSLFAGLVRWRAPLPVYFVAIAAIPLIQILAVALTAGLASFQPAAPGLPWYLGILVPLEICILGGPLGEELGWRAYALRRLLPRYGGVAASLAVALMRFVWHIPLFWVPGSAQADMPMALFALTLLGYSFLSAWVWVRSAGSTLLAMIFHTSANTSFWAVNTYFSQAFSHRYYGIVFVGLVLAAATAAGLGLPPNPGVQRTRFARR